MADKYEVLKRHFGYTSFRNGQEELIDALLSGRDVLGVMPTGAGKSLCYQVPAMLFDGVTIVVSPLISLMKDQVSALVQQGISAAFVNSTLNLAQYSKVLRNIKLGAYKIIYVAPERLLSDGFLSLSRELNISLLAVDEAHCVSQWGQDFRPSYLDINTFISALPSRPTVGAFTATATAEVRDDIAALLQLDNPLMITTGFDRPNLFFSVMKPADKKKTLLGLLEERSDKSGIIYCSTRKKVEEICDYLNEHGFRATRYHAGLSDEERRRNQDDFVFDRAAIIVATNAFGMGIDKSNVGFVIHFNMPKNIESYYQEAGRAGRDGTQADCILLYAKGDVRTAQFFIDNSEPNPNLSDEENELFAERERDRLRQMVLYCTTTDCLRKFILRYFGDSYNQRCENCSSCLTNYETVDITTEAQKILSCVVRMRGRFGKKTVADVLLGKKNEKIESYGLDELSTYGIMRDNSAKELMFLIDRLQELGYIEQSGKYAVIETTAKSAKILRGEERITIHKAKSAKQHNRFEQLGTDTVLLDRLKALRRELAESKRVPSYVIFTDKTLIDMSRKQPITKSEFLKVSGVGDAKLKSYGAQFISLISEYRGEPKAKADSIPNKSIKKEKPSNAGEKWTQQEIDKLIFEFNLGMPVKQIADNHRRTSGAIISRLKKEGLISE